MNSNKPSSSMPEVVVVASTKRVDAIYPTPRRSGHFDVEIEVILPNEEERFQILKLYTKRIPLDSNVDLKIIAASCDGLLGLIWRPFVMRLQRLQLKKSSNANEDASKFNLTMEAWKNARSVVGPSKHNKMCYCGNSQSDLR